MYKVCLAMLCTLSLLACNNANQTKESSPPKAQAQANSESEKLAQWFDKKFEEELMMSPLTLTTLGRKERYNEIDAFTEAEALKQLEWKKASVAELKNKFDYNKLSPDAKTSYDLWVIQYEKSKKDYQFRDQDYQFHQMGSIQTWLPQFLINYHKVADLKDMEAYIARVGGAARAIEQSMERAKRYSKNGVRPPRFAYEGVIEQSQNIISGKPFNKSDKDSPLWADANKKIDALVENKKINASQAKQLKAQVKDALTNKFLPTYQSLISWAKQEQQRALINPAGVGMRRGGLEYYDYRLQTNTTTTLSAHEVHQIGKNEVARLRNEMIGIKNSVGFKGDLSKFFEFIKTDDQFFYPNTDAGRQAYIDDSKAFLAFIDAQLPKYFGRLPKAKLEVRRVEAFRERDGAPQHYSRGTPDGSRPGVYYAHLSDMRAMPKNEMEAIAYHEGSPGHHMQISIAQELQGIPTFRTQAFFTSYVEGWALYSELLAKEMGAYQNPYSDFGRLITEMWRAVRLVVDTGMHAKGWTEAEAIRYFKQNTPIPDEAVKTEVRRYLVWPGQALAYKIGMLKIQELRAQAEADLGDKFDLRAFHDLILGGGALPLNLLEKRVKHWVDTVSKNS